MIVYPIRLTEGLHADLSKRAEALHVPKQEAARMALSLGLRELAADHRLAEIVLPNTDRRQAAEGVPA